jgi:hypothetical protein
MGPSLRTYQGPAGLEVDATMVESTAWRSARTRPPSPSADAVASPPMAVAVVCAGPMFRSRSARRS